MTLELYRSLAFRGYHHAQRCLLNVLAFTWVNVHSKKIKETVWTFVDKRGVLRVMKLYSARINGSLIKHLLKRNEILGKNILHYAMHVRWHVCPWHKKIKKINSWKGCISPGASVPILAADRFVSGQFTPDRDAQLRYSGMQGSNDILVRPVVLLSRRVFPMVGHRLQRKSSEISFWFQVRKKENKQ